MSPSAPGTSPAAAAALPPLPAPSSGGTPQQSLQSPMASLMSGLMPVKTGVDQILTACRQIVQSGVIPGSEQVCGQIVALATSLLPMAAQQLTNPMGQGQIGPVQPGV